mmetsp:Transcript_84778/g.243319  ORF Transcript_84778/g.243319 Transcript_84778/m.243319 type:complete len:353 (+) Transcript_84778:111-1169(+)
MLPVVARASASRLRCRVILPSKDSFIASCCGACASFSSTAAAGVNEVDRLRSALDSIAGEAAASSLSYSPHVRPTATEMTPRTRRGAVRRVRATAMPVLVATAPTAMTVAAEGEPGLIPWSSQPVPADPTEGMLALQQEAWHKRLDEDRKLMYYEDQRRASALLKKALEPVETEVEPEELPPGEVQEIFNSMVVDPARELAERRDARVGESLAIHLEQLLTCNPPLALLAALGTELGGRASLRVEEVVAPGVSGLPFLVLLAPTIAGASLTSAASAALLRKRLDAAAPFVAAALARRMMLSCAPELRFVLRRDGGALERASPRSPLWRIARHARRTTVHNAMKSFAANMTWT